LSAQEPRQGLTHIAAAHDGDQHRQDPAEDGG